LRSKRQERTQIHNTTWVLDTGFLLALFDTKDTQHIACVLALTEIEKQPCRIVVPVLCVAEVSYFLGERTIGTDIEVEFLETLITNRFELGNVYPGDILRMAELVQQYGNFPLGSTDASLIALTERLMTNKLGTLDKRHMMAVKARHCAYYDIIPE
jgi:predicted nucleic acid-binding protein